MNEPNCIQEETNISEELTKYEKETINEILAIKTEVEEIEKKISGPESENIKEEFRKFEEILIQKTLKLDNIDTKGIEKIKEIRRNAILYVQSCLKLMDSKQNC